jgi:hypothetical protein
MRIKESAGSDFSSVEEKESSSLLVSLITFLLRTFRFLLASDEEAGLLCFCRLFTTVFFTELLLLILAVVVVVEEEEEVFGHVQASSQIGQRVNSSSKSTTELLLDGFERLTVFLDEGIVDEAGFVMDDKLLRGLEVSKMKI